MELKRDIERALKALDPKVRVVLLHGPDAGLVSERARMAARTACPDLNDPFRVSELTASMLDSDPARLADEAAALAMLGGRRVVRISGAGDKQASLVEGFLAAPPGDALVVIEAGELTRRSKLRAAVEASPRGVAAACYGDDPRALEGLVDRTLAEAGLKIDDDARAYLLHRLGEDRLVSRQELDKLVLYMASSAQRTVTLADAAATVGDTLGGDLDAVTGAALEGRPDMLDRALTRCLREGMSPIRLLRAVSGQLLRLHVVQGRMAHGLPFDKAISALRPPLPYPAQEPFRRQLGIWTAPRILPALDLLGEAELNCKTTGLPAEAICHRALLRLAAGIRQRRR
ncbi:DNA polymerase III subunit delta [Zavarzinia sp. CC-PAN008]|uniref:DNA polymerase III subunit delta n=1 Tax=Zavarzinia sp. CC-PAN008 TaxID=3243332 RepID=UPI003F74549D